MNYDQPKIDILWFYSRLIYNDVRCIKVCTLKVPLSCDMRNSNIICANRIFCY